MNGYIIISIFLLILGLVNLVCGSIIIDSSKNISDSTSKTKLNGSGGTLVTIGSLLIFISMFIFYLWYGFGQHNNPDFICGGYPFRVSGYSILTIFFLIFGISILSSGSVILKESKDNIKIKNCSSIVVSLGSGMVLLSIICGIMWLRGSTKPPFICGFNSHNQLKELSESSYAHINNEYF